MNTNYFSHPESDLGNTYTAEVEIRKRENPNEPWVATNTLSRSYRVDFVPRGANCPVKIRVEDDEVKTEQDTFILIYPNPANKKVVVSSKENISSIRITNNLGQVVHFMSNISALKKEIDISKLSNGIYYVQIETKNKLETSKLIKE